MMTKTILHAYACTVCSPFHFNINTVYISMAICHCFAKDRSMFTVNYIYRAFTYCSSM